MLKPDQYLNVLYSTCPQKVGCFAKRRMLCVWFGWVIVLYFSPIFQIGLVWREREGGRDTDRLFSLFLFDKLWRTKWKKKRRRRNSFFSSLFLHRILIWLLLLMNSPLLFNQRWKREANQPANKQWARWVRAITYSFTSSLQYSMYSYAHVEVLLSELVSGSLSTYCTSPLFSTLSCQKAISDGLISWKKEEEEEEERNCYGLVVKEGSMSRK